MQSLHTSQVDHSKTKLNVARKKKRSDTTLTERSNQSIRTTTGTIHSKEEKKKKKYHQKKEKKNECCFNSFVKIILYRIIINRTVEIMTLTTQV
jgi:hypothetical protein